MRTPEKPAPRRGRPWAEALLGHRTLVLGIALSAGGLAGAVREAANGAGALQVLAPAGLGILGTALAIATVLSHAKR
ncbi:hypothetical protein ACZ90_25020 [Streptomyces albus subsp. albus]|nr:hypothetical protein ACZ90_25020 [Streptomyces albus subsp. albus]